MAGGKTGDHCTDVQAPDSGEAAARIGGEPMQQRRTAAEPAPPRTYRPLRQIVVFLCITYGLTLAIALALPDAGITSQIAIAFPVIAVALTVAFTVPRGQRRAVWAAVTRGWAGVCSSPSSGRRWPLPSASASRPPSG